jgi:phosphopantothenoylcysteine decarboxylase/phosphopantothenate--cysteine ligase
MVETALEMEHAVLDACVDADVLLMAAAVADFRPAHSAHQKIKKETGVPTIALEQNPDILLSVARQRETAKHPQVVVGFAAETENLMEHAQSKLERKGLTMIVANDVSATDAGFAVDTNRVTILGADGSQEVLPLMSKAEVAQRVIQRVVKALQITSVAAST